MAMALVLLLLLQQPRTLTISLVLGTRRRLQLLHLCSALFSHHPHPRDRGEIEFLVILVEAAARVLCIRIMKVRIRLATLTRQSTTAAKKTIMYRKVGVHTNPRITSITLRKMGVMMTIRVEVIQTVLQEETGGRGHFITKFCCTYYLNSPPFGRGVSLYETIQSTLVEFSQKKKNLP